MTEDIYTALGITPTVSRGSQDPKGTENSLINRAANAMDRYRDGYGIASAIDNFGGVIKVIALILGGCLVLAGIISCFGDTGFLSGTIGTGLIIAGLFVGCFGFILGILVRAIGQLMKALFDVAVNGSHFLDDAQRAKVMSLE